MARPSGNCPLCGTWRFRLQREHIIPKWEGGTDTPENIQYICANCHEDKTRAEALRRRALSKGEFSQAAIQKAADSNRGKKRSQEFRDRQKAFWTPEQKEKHRQILIAAHKAGNYNHSPSPEVRNKISISGRLYWTPEKRAEHSAKMLNYWKQSKSTQASS